MKRFLTRLRFRLAVLLFGPLPINAMAHSIAHELIAEAQVYASPDIPLDRAHDAIVIGIETFWDLLNGEVS